MGQFSDSDRSGGSRGACSLDTAAGQVCPQDVQRWHIIMARHGPEVTRVLADIDRAGRLRYRDGAWLLAGSDTGVGVEVDQLGAFGEQYRPVEL